MILLRTIKENLKQKSIKLTKLTLLTLVTIFKDIIPGYKIRTLSDQESDIKISKDIKRMRQYEKLLLSFYQGFLQDLDSIINCNHI